jgi:dTDP-4-dehydrorhamnose reductase
MARLVITGATGLLGSTLVPCLAGRGHEVLQLRRIAPGTADNPGIMFADLTHYDSLGRALTVAAPDAIINLAAMTNVDSCERDPVAAYAGNTLVVENLVRWIENKSRPTHLVQISTDQVYDGPGGPHSEDVVRPVNYYAFSKLAAEYCAARVSATILRTNLFGRSRAPGRTSLSDWVVGVLLRQEPANVFDDVLFSPLSMDSLARYIEIATRVRAAGVFNLGSRDGMSKADFAFLLAETLGLSTDRLTRTVSTGANFYARRPLDMRMDSTRFERRFEIVLPTLQSEIRSMRQVYEHAA